MKTQLKIKFGILLLSVSGLQNANAMTCEQLSQDLQTCKATYESLNTEYSTQKGLLDLANIDYQNLIQQRAERQRCASETLALRNEIAVSGPELEKANADVNNLKVEVATLRDSARRGASRPSKLYECIVKAKRTGIAGYGQSLKSKAEAKKSALGDLREGNQEGGVHEICFESFVPAAGTGELAIPIKKTEGTLPAEAAIY